MSLTQVCDRERGWSVVPELKASQAVSQAVKMLTKVKTWQLTAGAATLGLALSAVAVASAGPWDSSGQRTAEARRAVSQEAGGGTDHGRDGRSDEPVAAPSARAVLAAPGGSVPGPTKRALADVLDPLLNDPALGKRRTAAVVDAATGERLYGKSSGDALTPASTTKLATAIAALSMPGSDHRIDTKTVIEPDSSAHEVVLVGGGDPTLTARKDAGPNASLRALADATAKELKGRDTDEITLSYDTSLYSGPLLHPIGPNENIAPVSALMADEARMDDSSSGPAPRESDPAAAVARKFADLLHDRGIKTKGEPGPAKASGDSEKLAKVSSPPYRPWSSAC